jgi:hypothetical protein
MESAMNGLKILLIHILQNFVLIHISSINFLIKFPQQRAGVSSSCCYAWHFYHGHTGGHQFQVPSWLFSGQENSKGY